MTIHSKNKSKLTWIYKLPSSQVLLMFPPLPEIHPTGDTSAAGDAPITELDDSEILLVLLGSPCPAESLY